MAAETGNTFISQTVRDTTEILTANPAFSTMASSTKLSPSDRGSTYISGQRSITGNGNMVANTGNTYISGTMTYITEVLKSGVFDHAELEETVLGRLRQRSTTGNGSLVVFGANLAIFG